MTTAQRLLLVLIVLAAGGAVGALLLWGGDDPGRGPRAVGETRPGRDVVTAGPAAIPVELVGGGTTERVSAAGDPVGGLELKVIDESGRHLPAQVRLTGPDGLLVESTGSQTWRDLPVGQWTVDAEHEELLTHHQAFEVAQGETTRLILTLSDVIRIRGRISDRFGEPWKTVPVWFLRPKQSHPADRPAARKLIATSGDVRGAFDMEISRAGRYRLSIGQPGNAVATMDEMIELFAGGPTEVRVVLEGSTRLSVELQDPPRAVSEGRTDLQIGLLIRPDEREGPRRKRRLVTGPSSETRSGGEDGKRSDIRRRKARNTPERERLGGRGNEQEDELVEMETDDDSGSPEESDQEPVAGPEIDDDEQRWVAHNPVRLPADGRLILSHLPAAREMRVVLHRRKDNFQSQVFTLSPDRTTLLRFSAPAKRSSAEIELQPQGDLAAFVMQEALPRDAPEPGFSWEQPHSRQPTWPR